MKHNKFPRILTFIFLILLVLLIVFFATHSNIDPKIIDDSYHKDFYTQAENTWAAKLEAQKFREQALGELTFGSSSYVSLNWQKPRYKYNHFLITVSNPETGWTRTESGNHDRDMLDLSDLKPATEYTFVVQVCFDPECKKWDVTETEAKETTSPLVWEIDTNVNNLIDEPFTRYTEQENWEERYDFTTARFFKNEKEVAFDDIEIQTAFEFEIYSSKQLLKLKNGFARFMIP